MLRRLVWLPLLAALASFALLLWLLPTPPANGAPPTRRALTFTEAPAGTHTATARMQGRLLATIGCSAPGSGASWTYALATRQCDDDGDCESWAAATSGSVSGTDGLSLQIAHPVDELRLVLVETGGTPVTSCTLTLY